jgi:hypothetical protein
MSAMQDSFHLRSIGPQSESKKETLPAYSFGTASREVTAKKVFISKKATKTQAIMNSPGPVYAVASSVGDSPKFGFGTEEQRPGNKSKYDDSSVDLTCATVDSQSIKFPSTAQVHFGTEVRMNKKNGEAIKANPQLLMGLESPCYYSPRLDMVVKTTAAHSFGPPSALALSNEKGAKSVQRVTIPPTSTPRHVGPGSHSLPSGTGNQPVSARSTAPSWRFGSSCRVQELTNSTDVSNIGKSLVFEITLTKNGTSGPSSRLGVKLGVDLSTDGDSLKIKSIMKGGLISQWNQENTDTEVRPFDRIVEVNNVRGGEGSLKKALMSDDKSLTLVIKREMGSSQDPSPKCVFGTSTREHAARTAMAIMEMDRGPVADMPKPRFHCDLPALSRMTPRPGL